MRNSSHITIDKFRELTLSEFLTGTRKLVSEYSLLEELLGYLGYSLKYFIRNIEMFHQVNPQKKGTF